MAINSNAYSYRFFIYTDLFVRRSLLHCHNRAMSIKVVVGHMWTFLTIQFIHAIVSVVERDERLICEIFRCRLTVYRWFLDDLHNNRSSRDFFYIRFSFDTIWIHGMERRTRRSTNTNFEFFRFFIIHQQFDSWEESFFLPKLLLFAIVRFSLVALQTHLFSSSKSDLSS